MKTIDIKCGVQYLCDGKIVTVVKRIPGRETNKPNMQSGMMFTGNKKTQKKFLLSNGEHVKAQRLNPIDLKS